MNDEVANLRLIIAAAKLYLRFLSQSSEAYVRHGYKIIQYANFEIGRLLSHRVGGSHSARLFDFVKRLLHS